MHLSLLKAIPVGTAHCNSCFFFPCDLYPPQQVALNVLGQRLPPPPLSLKLAQLRPWLSPGRQGVQGTTVAPLVLGKTWERYYTVTIVIVLALIYHMYRFTMFIDIEISWIYQAFDLWICFFSAVCQGAFLCCADALLCYGSGPRSKVGWGRECSWAPVGLKTHACQTGHRSTCHSIIGGYTQMGGMPAFFGALKTVDLVPTSYLWWQTQLCFGKKLQLVYFWSSTWKERVSPHTDSWNPISASLSLKASPNLRTQLWVDCWADRVGGRSNVEGIWTESHRCIDWDWWYLEWWEAMLDHRSASVEPLYIYVCIFTATTPR